MHHWASDIFTVKYEYFLCPVKTTLKVHKYSLLLLRFYHRWCMYYYRHDVPGYSKKFPRALAAGVHHSNVKR